MGFEPTAPSLRTRCSPAELHPRNENNYSIYGKSRLIIYLNYLSSFISIAAVVQREIHTSSSFSLYMRMSHT